MVSLNRLLLLFLAALTSVQISLCVPLPEQVVGTLPQFPISSPIVLTDNTEFELVNQTHPVYYLFSKPYPASTVVSSTSSQGIVNANRGNANQFVQQTSLPVSGAFGGNYIAGTVYSNPTTMYGWGVQNAGTSQNSVSLNPFLQTVKQDLQSWPISFQSNNFGGLVKNTNTNSVNNNGILGITSTTDGVQQTTMQQPGITSTSSYQQSLVRPAAPVANTVLTSTTVEKDAVVTLPNSEYSTIGVPASYVSSSTANAFGSNTNLNKGPFVTMSAPNYNYGLQGSSLNLKNFGISPPGVVGSIDNVVSTTLQTPGVQAQIIQVPCTLNIQSPIPVTVNSGISQISTQLPIQQASIIPPSFIDQSPPTIAVLRPPSSYISVIESENLPVVTAPALSTIVAQQQASQSQPTNNAFIIDSKLTESSLATTINEQTQQKARHQEDSRGVLNQNNDEQVSEIKSEFAPGLARHGLPTVYAMLPPQLSSPPPVIVSGAASVLETSSRGKNKNISKPQQQQQQQQQQPSRGTNPFFNVNKRKHFEFYQYF